MLTSCGSLGTIGGLTSCGLIGTIGGLTSCGLLGTIGGLRALIPVEVYYIKNECKLINKSWNNPKYIMVW